MGVWGRQGQQGGGRLTAGSVHAGWGAAAPTATLFCIPTKQATKARLMSWVVSEPPSSSNSSNTEAKMDTVPSGCLVACPYLRQPSAQSWRDAVGCMGPPSARRRARGDPRVLVASPRHPAPYHSMVANHASVVSFLRPYDPVASPVCGST